MADLDEMVSRASAVVSKVFWWSVAIVTGAAALWWFSTWARANMEEWRWMFLGGLGGAMAWELNAIRKLLTSIDQRLAARRD
jgi:hypothetical protein